jgi:DNA-binding PadR family transcriptional regulator
MIRDFFLGFIKLHVLYHAAREPIFGLDLIRELGSHGYQLSPGTLYPLLHGLEREGHLRSEKRVVNGKVRKYYTATDKGRTALAEAYAKTRELLREISQGFEEPEPPRANGSAAASQEV